MKNRAAMKKHKIKKDVGQNGPVNPERKLPSFGKNLSQYFSDYSSNTSIQGIKYLGEKNLTVFEKLFWLVFISISIYLCGYLIHSVYGKWRNDPVIVTFSNKLIPVWDIPFPAVTICPEGKSRRTVYNYTETYNKFQSMPDSLTEERLKRFEQMNVLCADTLLPNGSATIGNDTIDFLFNIAPSCDKWGCTWNDDLQPCNSLLVPILTDDGVCFSFNMLDREELFTNLIYYPGSMFKHGIKSTNWSLEKGYANNEATEDYPRKTSAESVAFHMAMMTYEPELDYGCRGHIQGYKVLLHHPAEIPGLKQKAFIASFDKQMHIAVKPQIMATASELESYHPEQRQCYFSYERRLKYFQVYTQSNCELECLTNQTLKLCGCVSFYMPRDTGTNFCGRAKYVCTTTAKKMMVTKGMKLGNSEPQENCNCLPSCISLTYDTETASVDDKWKKSFQARNRPDNLSGLSLTQLSFSFKAQYVIVTERKELYGLTDLIANCGGLLGLFLGFSFLSVVEIIYFLTVRLVCNIRTYGLHFWSGSVEIALESKGSMT